MKRSLLIGFLLLSVVTMGRAQSAAQSKKIAPSEVAQERSKLTKEQIVAELQTELQKQAALNKKNFYELMEKGAQELQSSYSQDFLLKLLPFYIQFNKLDQTHFFVEMFVEVYKKNTKDFEAAMSKSFSEAQKEEFMRKLKLAITESEEGNG